MHEKLIPLKNIQNEDVTHLVFPIPRLNQDKRNDFGSLAEVAVIRGVKPEGATGQAHDSICISCATGCPVGCGFCATGDHSKESPYFSLSAEEMIQQVISTQEIVRSSEPEFGKRGLSISFMGKGEPELNPDAVVDAYLQMMNEGIVTRGTIATTGRADLLSKLARTYREKRGNSDIPAPYLQLSLSSPLRNQRNKLIGNEKLRPDFKETLAVAAQEYAPLLVPDTKISIRITLMNNSSWGSNYSFEALDFLIKETTQANRQFGIKGKFGGFYVVVANLNQSETSIKNGISPGHEEDVDAVIEYLKQNGIEARPFAGGSVLGSDKDGACGTMNDG